MASDQIETVIAPTATETVSPELVVLEAVKLPYSKWTGVPAESYSSIEVTVMAGMLVNVGVPELAIWPE